LRYKLKIDFRIVIGRVNVRIPIFFSYAKPFNKNQEIFIEKVKLHLIQNGFSPETLGVNFHGISTPLESIKDKMSKCPGLLSIAFRRAYVKKGTGKLNTDLEDQEEYDISEKWITSPYCQIEPSMAFQIGIPILIFREKGVIADGILEKGVVPYYMPEFDLSKSIDEYFESSQWIELIKQWKEKVLNYKTKKLFEEDDIIKHIISYSLCKGKKISPEELYNMFNNTIDNDHTSHSGQRVNNYAYFLNQLKSCLNVDENDLEKEYKLPYHSLHSDYISICTDFFY
jgi:hypothetical protein